MINKSTIKIHISINAFVHLALSGNQLRREAFHGLIQTKFLIFSLCVGKFSNKFFKDLGARVGNGINSMSNSIN